MLVLTVAKGPDRGKVFELRGVSRVIIGRNSPDLKLNDIMISRYHAKLKRDGERWLVRDLGSRNGTKLNGERLVRVAILKTGDHIVTGYTEFEVSYVSDPSDAVAFHEPQAEADDDAQVDVPVSVQQVAPQEESHQMEAHEEDLEITSAASPASDLRENEAAASLDDNHRLIGDPLEPSPAVAMAESDATGSDIAEEADITEQVAKSVIANEAASNLSIEQIGEVETDEPAQTIEVDAEPTVVANEWSDEEVAVVSAAKVADPAMPAAIDLESKVIEADPPVECEARAGSVERDLAQPQTALASEQIKGESKIEIPAEEIRTAIEADEPVAESAEHDEPALAFMPVLSEQGMLNLAPIDDKLDDDQQRNPTTASPSRSPKGEPPQGERAASEWMSAIESQLIVAQGQGWDDVADEEEDGFIDALEDDMEPLENEQRSLLYFDEDDHWAEDVQLDDDALVNSLEEDGPEALLRDLQIKPGNNMVENPASKTTNGNRKGKKKQR